MLPRAEQSNEEPESQKSAPWDTLVRQLFPEGREQQHEQQKPLQLSGFLLCCLHPDSCVTAAAISLVTTDWGKGDPFSCSHHYISSQLQQAVVTEAAIFLLSFRSSNLSIFPLLSLAREIKLLFASPKGEVLWLAAQGGKKPKTQICPSYLGHSR